MPRYIVTGPEREYMEWVCEYGGPTYIVWDSYVVDAKNKREAAWAAFRRAKKLGDLWYTELSDYEKHPLSGVKVELVAREDYEAAWNGWPKTYRISEAVYGT